MLSTRFTDLVGCTVPIQQAPIGGCASPRLAAAVAEAGGLGMVSVTGDPPEIVAAQLDQARQLSAGQIGVLSLLDAVLAAVDVPVLAAGGIGSGRALAAVLAAGADGVRIGTRFVAAEEAEAHPRYVEALIAARPTDTLRSDTFALDFPGAPHRALRSSISAVEAFQGDVVGEVLSPSGDRVPVRRFQKLTITRHVSGAIEAMPHWAGESVGGVTRIQPAAEIVRELADQAERLLRRWGPEGDPYASA